MAKLSQNPADGLEFDRCRPNMNRREHVESVLNAVHATIAETQALKSRLAASRAKVAALESARITHLRLKGELTLATNRIERGKSAPPQLNALQQYERLKQSNPVAARDFLSKRGVEIRNFMKTPPPPPQAPTATAESFATAPLTMLRSEFVKLSAIDKARFVKAKGKLV